MSEKKDRELSEKELEKAAGGGQPFGTEPGKDTKSPYGGGARDQELNVKKEKPFGDADPSKGKG